MLRFLFAIALVAASVEAAAQNQVLVQRPPVYRHGESATGVLTNQLGLQVKLRQEARRGRDGKIYLFMTMIDEFGNVLSGTVIDPRTWRGQSMSDSEHSETVDTTCSSAGLYPITERKVYECSSTIKVNDRIVTSHSRMEFNHVARNKKGHIADFCASVEEKDSEYAIKSRMCFSPDGKWIRNMHIIEVIPFEKT